ncbi:MAG: hypothetical protein ABIL58_25900, partial [Pseudomonadota bacterium]
QAEQMRAFVGELMALVNGGDHGLETRDNAGAGSGVIKIRKAMHLPRKQAGKRTLQAIAHQDLAASLGSEDFGDF